MTPLPHWDLTNVFPSLESPEFEQGFAAVGARVNALAEMFDAQRVERIENAVTDAETARAFDAVLDAYNATLDSVYLVAAYIQSFVTTDSRNALAQAKLSALQIHLATLSKLGTRLTAWLGSLDTDTLVAQSETARAHAYALERARTEAAHQMSPVEEELAAELNLSGGSAWARLHGNVSSQIMVDAADDLHIPELDGKSRELRETNAMPMSAVRNLAYHADRSVRARAHFAELAAWEKHAVPLAAALNSIKGQMNTLSARRYWESALDAAIFDAAIDRATLDAMLTAAREFFPVFRRYLRSKARALGLEQLAFYDIFAPLGAATRVWSYDDARDFILTHFGSYSDRMQSLARRAFDENWIDAEPRAGKRDGAFCMRLRADESRVLTNFKPAFGGMSTLAHELGHAYHNMVLAPRTAVQRSTPMTLAETASIFCETIVKQAALRETSAQEQLAILESSLQGSCQVVVDISSRFLFEQRVFDGRRAREWSVQELCELMTDAQKETYGDGLDESQLHPYMWAAKPHYYRDSMAFYNFPYMFGLLFGLGLYAQYRANPDDFKQNYDALLSSTGMADAATLAARFGFDLRQPDFWRASLRMIEREIELFEELVG